MSKLSMFFGKSRAQIALFMVVGLVLLGIVGILFALSTNIRNEEIQRTNPGEEQYKYDTAIKIIRDCIQVSTQQSVQLVALQGGALYYVGDQGGLDTKAFSDIAIAVSRFNQITEEPSSPLSNRTLPLDPALNPLSLNKLGGQIVLEKLCDRYGPNNPANSNASLTCTLPAYGYDGDTIQNKLASSIQKKTISCVKNSKAVLEVVGNVSTYFGVKPQVILGDDQLTVSYVFDSNISITKSNFSYFQSTVTIPVRLKRLYNFISALLTEDTTDITFDKLSGYQFLTGCNYPGNNACWYSGFDVTVQYGDRDPVSGKSYDMVIVKDSNSTILGDPLTFKFYIENRRPVLAPLVTMPGFGPASFPSTIHPLAPLDITLVNDKYVKYTDAGIVILPVAYDYDEDDLVYTYSKWKGTFDVAFATGTISQQTAGCRFLTPFFCYYWDASFLLPSTPIAASNNEWHKSALYVSGDPGMNCLPNQCAQYDFKPAPDDVLDIGPHTTTVTVTDRGGLTDYADAVIIVGTD